MSEHVHLTQIKPIGSNLFEVRTVVRRKFIDGEVKIVQKLGYAVELRYCGDPACLGPEPTGYWKGGGSG